MGSVPNVEKTTAINTSLKTRTVTQTVAIVDAVPVTTKEQRNVNSI